MATENESVMDVCAEWRDCIEAADPSVWNDERIAGLVKTTKAQQLAYLGRLEEAWKRELEKIAAETRQRSAADSGCPNVSKNTDVIIAQSALVGNAAAMREALKKIYSLAQSICDYKEEPTMVYLRADLIERTVNAALSAPPRNCDRYKDAASAYADFIVPWKLDGHLDDVPTLQDFANWLFDPAEKGADA